MTELFAFQHDQGADGNLKPALIRLSDESRELLAESVHKKGAEQPVLTGDLSAAWSKLEEIPTHLSLVIRCIWQTSGEPVDPWICDAGSMKAAVTLTGWFEDEIQRARRKRCQEPFI